MINLPTPVQELSHPILEEKGVRLYVKRDDLTHPDVMGNKWRKLKYNIQKAQAEGYKGLLTLGGAYSNHIAATAALAYEKSLKSVGIIRGEELNKDSNPTLMFASSRGMELVFVSREEYRQAREDPARLISEYHEYYFLPEGGTNALAIEGCRELVEEIDVDFDVIVTPIGTGGTFSGILKGINADQRVIGISALKGAFMHREIQNLLREHEIEGKNYEVNTDYHFGGYGKFTNELIDFMRWFKENFNIQLDPIYTGKSFFAVWDMIKSSKFENNPGIILLHTGGLQGIKGFNRKNENIV